MKSQQVSQSLFLDSCFLLMTNRPEEGVADDEAVRWARDETEKHKEVQKGPSELC